jgi:UDP-2-acetamido-3-amino-2,3-dideoxy-glucuronate N-acetyltransferase
VLKSHAFKARWAMLRGNDMGNYFQHEKAIVDQGASIGRGTRIWAFTNVQAGAVIGEGCNICDGCFVETGAVIGNHVTLKNGVAVFKGVILEDDVFCGANTAFTNDRYPRSHGVEPWTQEETIIKKGVSIGCNASILCGISIEPYAVIGAGSVITCNVASHAVFYGNPARHHGFACICGRTLKNGLECLCGRSYKLEADGLVEKTGVS